MEITLTNTDRVALIDPGDYEILSPIRWRLCPRGQYVIYCNKGERVMMHRIIACLPKPDISYATLWVDHINRNGLDNRRVNLRIVTPMESAWNRASSSKTSSYKGISLTKRGKLKKPWNVQITVNKQRLCLGAFATQEDAARAYDEAARKYYGEFACVNFPKEGEQGCLT